MSAQSDWLEQHLLDHNLNDNALATAITQASVYVSLHLADPTDVTATALANEVSTGLYARVTMTAGWTIAQPAGVTTAKNTLAVTFPTETEGSGGVPYGPVTHFGIFNASSAGELLYHGAVSPQNSVGLNDTPSFAADSLILEASTAAATGAFSDYLELENMKHVLNNATANDIAPASVYVALFTSDPTDDASGDEVPNANLYAREQMTAGWTLDGTSGIWTAKNTAKVDFGTTNGAWGTVTHFGIFDSGTWGAGNLFYHGELDNAKPIGNGDNVEVAATTLSIELR